ncbi:phage tail tape measure protein [Streptomyces sp. NPDC058291]|uniref:phage tail tape measure protein n=1 Tax=Streptomyces sp. NPDC058291 TaxID=3346427 RepID=UPI0036DFAB94
MATRTVNVRLVADVSNYTRSMRTAARSTSQMANAGAIVGTALVAGFAVAAASAAKFDKALSNVRAVSGASRQEMGQLRAAALEAGRTTSFTATQAADAEAELARAGVSVANITGGALKGALALAASGQVDLTEAAVVSAQAMNTFGLAGKDVTHIADLLAAGANKSAADVHGLAMSLRMGGLLAHQTGLSIEDTVGTLAAFADHALIGSDAGTSLKVMLQRLVPQSKEAKGMMDKIGFSAYDANGKFVGLTEMAGRMKTSFSKLTPEARNAAMATIFGADAVRSATILYELGSDGIAKYVNSVNDQGAAQRMAAVQTDNLIGDFERLRGALEVALIEGGSAANGSLRTMTQWITRLINAYSSLSPEMQHAVTLFMGFGGAASLAAAGVLLLLPRIAATRAALVSMGLTAARTRIILGTLGKVGAVVAGMELLSYASQQVRDQFKDSPPSVSKMASSLVDLGKNGKVSGEALDKLGGHLDGFGEAVKRVAHPDWEARTTDVVNSLTLGLTKGMMESQIPLDEAHDKITAVDEALAQLAQSGNAQLASDAFNRLAGAAAADGTSKEKLLTLMPEYTDALAQVDVQSKTSAVSQEALAKQLGVTADELQDQRSEAEKLVDALKALNGVNISTAEKEIGFRQSLADLTEAVKDNGHSLDVTSEKGRKVKSAFLEAAQAAMDHAQAVAEQQQSQQAGQAVLEKDISLLRQQMRAAGFSKDAIDKLVGAYLQLPVSVTTAVKAETGKAVADLQGVQKQLRSTKSRTVTVSALTSTAEKNLINLGFKVTHMKNGKVSVTIPTGPPIGAVNSIQGAINNMSGKTIGIGVLRTEYLTTVRRPPVTSPTSPYGFGTPQANGSVLSFYANGGMRENHVAQIARKGSWRVWAEDEAGDEAYIPLAPGKRPRSRQIAAETVKRLGGQVQWFAGGGLPGFTYAPTGSPVLGGPSDAKKRYDDLVGRLADAWKEYRQAIAERDKVLKDKKSTKAERAAARKAVAQEYATVKGLDAALGLKAGTAAPKTFNLASYQKQLVNSLKATQAWRASLTQIGRRGGEEVRALLEGMGEDGYALVNTLARANDKQFRDITARLKATGELAKATLADFTKQLGASTKESQAFSKDLQTLASRGFGNLAQALAAQGDSAAMSLAHEAVGNSKSAAAADKAVTTAQSALSGEDLANAVTLLSTLRGGPGRGFADLIAAGLDVATIRDLVPKMTAQIKALPELNRATFVRQWVQQGGKAMALGGILNRPSMVLGGEAGVPEAWIPLNQSGRSRTLLARSAAAMGYQLVPAGRYSSSDAHTAAVAREVTRQITVNLYGAKQSTAEQAHDVARYMSFVG